MAMTARLLPIIIIDPFLSNLKSSPNFQRMALNLSSHKNCPGAAAASSPANAYTNGGRNRKLPVLLFDIMDTIVRDPFYHDVPPFFGMSFEELIECKHPTAWMEFEKGMIDEWESSDVIFQMELARKFFKDGRHFDLEGLKSCMRRGYSFIDGIEALLCALKQKNYDMHAFTNYPIWYSMIEEELNISRYISWTFCSCIMGKRKPDPELYNEVLNHLEVDPASCIFIDDRLKNVEAAIEVGIVGLHFKDADSLREDLFNIGIDVPTRGRDRNDDRPHELTEIKQEIEG